jgi:hypothetical protein
MAANAPYYQRRARQFIAQPDGTNTTPSHFAVEDSDYDRSAAAVASPHEHHSSLHTNYTTRPASADISMNSLEESHNLAELLEAATSAAGQAPQAVNVQDTVEGSTAEQGKGKRKRVSSPPVDSEAEAEVSATTKSQRVDAPTDPQLYYDDRDSAHAIAPPSSESLLNDARAAGVHSAAALFRRTSERTSRKYTRPPMSKLFMSLQLSPENFLQLQASAKAYMLDTTHPERQNCVGNRGKGDTDMVKLRLFNCVRDFLNDGVGEQYFGQDVEKPGERDAFEAARALGEEKAPGMEEKLTWPRDGNKIISLVTPLMRRMVTNERQRMYAIETRKGGAKKKDKEGSAEAATQSPVASETENCNQGQTVERHLQSPFQLKLNERPPSQPTSASKAIPLMADPGPGTNLVRMFSNDFATNSLPTNNAVEIVSTFRPMRSLLLLHTNSFQIQPEVKKLPCIVQHINIFLAHAPDTESLNEYASTSILCERRIHCGMADVPNWYTYESLLHDVMEMLREVKSAFPHIDAHSTAEPYLTQPPGVATTGDKVDENLRGIAVAANALQRDDTPAATTALTPVEANKARLLPPHVIKTVGPDGWVIIKDSLQWCKLLLRNANAVWADKVINVVIELDSCCKMQDLQSAPRNEAVEHWLAEMEVKHECDKPQDIE